MRLGGLMLANAALSIVLVVATCAAKVSSENIRTDDFLALSNESFPNKDSGTTDTNKKASAEKSSLEWSRDLSSFERSENLVTRCRLRPINYWNYTQGQAKVVLGHRFESAIGLAHHYLSPSHDVFGSVNGVREVPIHRYKRRLFSIFNPFYLTSTDSDARDSANYILVNRKRKSMTNLSSVKSEHLVVDSQCSLVFIYARWCPFSMAAAPYVNALARAFPQLPVVAIDVDEYLRYRWSLRVFYVPKLKIFIGDNVYREFNGTDTDLDEMVDFVWRNLRIMPQGPVELRRSDFLGPIPNQLINRPADSRFLPLVWIVFLLSMFYFVASCLDWRQVRQHMAAALKGMSYLLDRRRGYLPRQTCQDSRSTRHHVAAHVALPPPPPLPPSSALRSLSSVATSTSADPHLHAE